MKQFVLENVRIQLFGGGIIRLEKAEDGNFCDGDTFFVPERKNLEKKSDIDSSLDGNDIIFGDYILNVPDSAKGLSGVTLSYKGQEVYRYERIKNSGELPLPIDTPEVFALADSPRIIAPEKGYTVHQDDCTYTVDEDAQDVYLLLCLGDHKKLRELYVELTGRPELVRLSALGSWNSKYFPYTEEEAKEVIEEYENHDVPLDVMVIDTDWRTSENGWGYDINEKLFPDMERFFRFAHEHGVEIMFNDHPEPQNGAHVFEKEEISYREENLTRLLSMGLDIWWYDRNWKTHLITPSDNIRWETLGLYLFWEVTENHYKKLSGDDKKYRRPVIMGNVNNIINGTYQGISDSASHRYSVQWTGDILSDIASLGQEVANIVRTGDNCLAYAHPDCGGHVGNPDRELFVRWMQMGALCPVLRPHCSCSVERFREPWLYDSEVLNIVREYIKMRYRLLPAIYARAFENHRTGAPIFASLGYNYPKDERASRCNNQYMLGRDVLIAPITGEFEVEFPKEGYASPVEVDFYGGHECKGEKLASATWQSLNMRLNYVSPAEGVPMFDFSARIRTTLKVEKEIELILSCDDGSTVWLDGKRVLEDKTFHGAQSFTLGILGPDAPHTLEIEYFQGSGEAACILMSKEIGQNEQKNVYFPDGQWLDLFDGSIYSADISRTTDCALREMPLFVRLGSLIPVAENANNTKKQSWQSLTYHYYPDKKAGDEGFVYEDDRETTAYKYGEHRISRYSAFFDGERGAYTVHFSKSEGAFDGSDAFESRNIALAIHKHAGMADIRRITLNGEDISFEIRNKNGEAMPFELEGISPDSDVALVRFCAGLDREYTVCIFAE
ncbi:MAG: TIM-barrel domain-containing protein [Eubacteriales bacterium]